MKEGKLHYVFNDFGEASHTIAATKPLPAGKITARVEFQADAGGLGKGASIFLSVNVEAAGTTRTERTPAAASSLDETFDVGADYGSPVVDQPAGSVYPGTIKKVTLDLK